MILFVFRIFLTEGYFRAILCVTWSIVLINAVQDDDIQDQLLTQQQAAERLGISHPTCRKMMRSGQLATVQLGGRVMSMSKNSPGSSGQIAGVRQAIRLARPQKNAPTDG